MTPPVAGRAGTVWPVTGTGAGEPEEGLWNRGRAESRGARASGTCTICGSCRCCRSWSGTTGAGRRRILGVDRRTLDASLDDGVLSRRIRGALEKALQSGVGSAAAQQRDRNDTLADRLGDVEGLVEELGQEMRAACRAAEDAIRDLREEQAQALRRLERALAGLDAAGGAGGAAGATATGAGPSTKGTAKLRQEYPDLVTLEPAEDDGDVFGGAWPLVQQWRDLKQTHPNGGRGLEWLRTEERFLAVELALLEEHGLTLPPARFPLRGFDRNGQVNWRRKALGRRKLLRWAGRVLTLGRWPR